jgi:hypothetical protein
MQPWRMVRLLVVDSEGRTQGITEERRVEMPWWQEVGPVNAAFPGATVLRLLSVNPEPGARAGGNVVYVAEFEGSSPPLEPWPHQPDEHPLRMPWARAGGPKGDLAWVRREVAVSGAARQLRSWNLSAIWAVPCGDGHVWLKCVAPFFEHEAAVLRVLDDQPVPGLIAADGHRLLLAELDGTDGYDATAKARRAIVDTLIEVQLAASSRVEALLGRRVPDRTWKPLAAELADIVARRSPENARLNALIASLDDRFAAIDACGLPMTLVHGDAHGGNARIGGERIVIFDWGDSFVGHPLLDLAVIGDGEGGGDGELLRYWIDRWRARVPGSDPHRAWELLRPVAALRAAWVYQTFLDHIEPSEHPYHRHDVQPAIDRAARYSI